MATTSCTVYIGSFVHCRSVTELEIENDGAIGVDKSGVIRFVLRGAGGNAENIKKTLEFKEAFEHGHVEFVIVKKGGWFFPGFIDTHIHASQYPNTGLFGKTTLLDWLNTYTFPLESSFSDLDKARKIYSRAVARTLAHGTTTASYYTTFHVPATNLLADICLAKGQRAFVGRVCMDQLSPEYYRDESIEIGTENSRKCIDYVRSIDPAGEIVQPIITPRFAPSCSKGCLAALGKLQKETDAYCQTHISENKPEIELVQQLFPESGSYANVYEEAGLLNEKMILAHAVHLTPMEKELIVRRKAKVSHCPASNTALTSGCCPVRDLIERGIDVGLGTDVSGGFSPSILEMVRQTVWVSRHLAMTDGDQAKLTHEEALYLATRGGAKVVGMQDKVGGFEVGKHFDAQMIWLGDAEDIEGCDEFAAREGPVDIFGWENEEDRIAKWVYNGDDRNTLAVWVKGRLVHRRKEYDC
ncbi:guanine deaminase [Pseudovirgaria hyperparasitica]|uniref:Guanine deaminase n=1 Tax=Pseudovirgaria hyperparasitica TaxID=470096 RepID=A0A6A6WE37_9PEZI|nr:guanine deaminase [Pseudovirgaria hyperparasitica]KAF2760983.1 guanine deaminase [Pseudovirgaria hyperparasitica]